MIAGVARRIRGILPHSRRNEGESTLPSTILAELAAMGALPADAPANAGIMVPATGEAARARILARHGHLAFINTNH